MNLHSDLIAQVPSDFLVFPSVLDAQNDAELEEESVPREAQTAAPGAVISSSSQESAVAQMASHFDLLDAFHQFGQGDFDLSLPQMPSEENVSDNTTVSLLDEITFTPFFNGMYYFRDTDGETQQQITNFGHLNDCGPATVPGSPARFLPGRRPSCGNSPSTLPTTEQIHLKETTLSLPIYRTLSQETVAETGLQAYVNGCGRAILSTHPVSMGASLDGTEGRSSSVVGGDGREAAQDAGDKAESNAKNNAEELPTAKKRRIDLVSEPPRTLTTYTDGAQIQGLKMVLGTSNRKAKALYTEQARQIVASSRSVGACNHCRKIKQRCDRHQKTVYEPCSRCANMLNRIPRMPCFTSQIADCIFFRKGPSFNGPQYFERRAVYELSDIPALPGYGHRAQEAKRLKLRQLKEEELVVYVDKYEPLSEEKLDWTKLNEEGEKFTMKMPPYCLTDMDKNRANMKSYVCKTRDIYLTMLQNGSELTWKTAEAAMEYAKSHGGSMTDRALDMWAYCRVIELPWKICGDDTLGVENGEAKSPWPGFVPVTPIMDVQLDQIVIKDILEDLKIQLLRDITKAVNHYSPTRWFDCYLTIFIILNHIEHVARHCHRFALSFDMGRRFSDMELVEGLFHSCKILLSRFHYISNGSGPFRIDWNNKKSTQFAQLDDEQLTFVKHIQALAIRRDDDFGNIKTKNQYERDTYWTHQLLDEKWFPGPARIEETVLD